MKRWYLIFRSTLDLWRQPRAAWAQLPFLRGATYLRRDDIEWGSDASG